MKTINLSRRDWMKSLGAIGLAAATPTFAPLPARANQQKRSIDIGSRRELFVDHFLIDKLNGARLKLHAPQPAEGIFFLDKPWEGVYCGYTTVFKDEDRYRLYYLGYPVDPPGNFTCYAESKARSMLPMPVGR